MKIGSELGGIHNAPDSEHTTPAAKPQRGDGLVARAPLQGPARSGATRETAPAAPPSRQPSASLGGLSDLRVSRTPGGSAPLPSVKASDAGTTDVASAAAITAKLQDVVKVPERRILVVSHSPPDRREVNTGAPGAHHAAASDGVPHLLDVVHTAARGGTLKPGSAVVLHLPAPWFRAPLLSNVGALIRQLQDKKVSVIVAQVDESIYGDLGGHADNPLPQPYRVGKLLPTRVGTPNAPTPAVSDTGGVPHIGTRKRVKDITHCAMPTADSLDNNVPMLSTKLLMESLQRLINKKGEKVESNMESHVGFLSDDADYERDSARDHGVTHSVYFDRKQSKLAVDTETSAGMPLSDEDVHARLFGSRG
jgi:hypothetical protein